MALTNTPPRRYPGRLFVALGLALPVLGVAAYMAQVFLLRQLWTPWYVPIAAGLGVLFMAVALWQARSFWRVLALVFVVLVAGVVWSVAVQARLPVYAGPTAGQAFPAFATARADGTAFTQNDLKSPQNSVLVFFRGRW
jgi:hypothetical protein